MSLAHDGIGGVPISSGDPIVVAETPAQHHGNSAQPEAAEALIETRRDFLKLTTGAFAAVGVGVVAWPFIHSMNPARDTLAMSTIEVDLTPIAEGQAVTAMLRGKPVFVRHRTAAEIQAARATPMSELKDPAPDQARVQRDAWLVLVGVCTHLGCVPLGQRAMDNRGDFGGWFCPCHGSHYDTSGRVRRGPAPTNLAVPTYTFMSPTQIRVG